ncbi:hypothetical protein FRC01_001191 [Tulasnella sp. 417]|nr:hypothetical protein FRC01_001191 [Tulasnella sp. 417]
MRFLAALIIVLAFGPTLLDYALSGLAHIAPAPTPVYPTKTFTDACFTRKATVEVSPTLVAPGHNSAKHSVYAFLVDSSISIPTAFRATPSLADAGHVAFAPKLAHGPQAFWTSHRHRCQCTLAWLMEIVVVFYLDVLAFLVVVQVLLRKRALQPHRLTSELVVQFKPTRVPVAWVEVPSVEGLLLLYSYITNSPKRPDQWRALWIPRRKSTYYLSNGPSNRDVVLVQPNALDSALLSILLASPVSYHPWAPQLAGIQVRLMASEQLESTGGRELCSVRMPHFGSAIQRKEYPSTGVVSQVTSQAFSPDRDRFPVDRIKIPSTEGVLILSALVTTSPHRPTEWTSQWFTSQPHTYYLSDRPANLDSLLLGILLQSISIHHPWAPQLAAVLLEIPGGVVEATDVTADTNSVRPTPISLAESVPGIEVEDPVALALGEADSSDDYGVEGPPAPLPAASKSSLVYHSDDIGPPRPPLQERQTSTSQVLLSAVPTLPSLPPSGSGSLPPIPYNTFAHQEGPSAYHRDTNSSTHQHATIIYQTPVPNQPGPLGYHPSANSAAAQHIPTSFHQYPADTMMPQSLPAEQAAVTRQGLHPLLPLLAERASQRQEPGPDSMGFMEEATEEENATEEVPKKKAHRGGKRRTARKHKLAEREQRREDEGNPGAGPSGTASN